MALTINPIGTVAQTPIDTSELSWLAGSWRGQLLPGSWRGVGFVMDAAPTKAGRRVALHEYPYRDTVWAEDLGKLPRRYQVQAYLTGDDVYQQRNRMVAACEQPGVGTLVHPTLGVIQCVLMDFTVTDRRERGRFVEIELEFIDYSSAVSPSAASATGALVGSLATALTNAGSAALTAALAGLKPTPTMPTAFVNNFSALAVNAVNDPARFLNSVTGLQGLFGRYSTGNMSTLQPATTTVDSALQQSVTSRQAVVDAADDLNAVADDV